jgi:uncharacterized repeat protein (TIGR02543 family)
MMYGAVAGMTLLLLIGLAIIWKPLIFLQFQDLWRISGDREYTDFAIISMRFGGIIIVLVSIIGLTSMYHDITEPYYVTLNVDGDTMVYEVIEVSKGDTIDLSEYTPTKEGYTFIGWTEEDYFFVAISDIGLTIEIVDNPYEPDEDIELTAVFVENTE